MSDVETLVQRLEKRTEAGQVEWEDRSGNALSFSHSSDAGAIVIDTVDNDGVAPYRLRIFNDEGGLVAGVDSMSSPDMSVSLRTIYQSARAQSLRVEQTIDSFLREFEE
jgi:hypothetical protein